MPAVPQVTKTGPRTYVPASGSPVTAGQVVEARAGGRIGPAAAASTKVLGVCLQDAWAPEDVPLVAGSAYNRSVLNLAVPAENVAVAYGGVEVTVVYAAAAAFGQLLVAAANGQVTPAAAGADVNTIVGRCTAPNGISGAGVAGLMRIGF